MTDQPLKLVIEETEHGVKKRTYAGDILSYQITVYEPDHWAVKHTGKATAEAHLYISHDQHDTHTLAEADIEADTTDDARKQAEAWVQARYSEAVALLLAHFQGGAE